MARSFFDPPPRIMKIKKKNKSKEMELMKLKSFCRNGNGTNET